MFSKARYVSRCDCVWVQVSEMVEAASYGGGGDELLVVEQIEQQLSAIVHNSEVTRPATDDLMRRSSPDGSTDNDDEHELSSYTHLIYLLTYLLTVYCGRSLLEHNPKIHNCSMHYVKLQLYDE